MGTKNCRELKKGKDSILAEEANYGQRASFRSGDIEIGLSPSFRSLGTCILSFITTQNQDKTLSS